MAKKTKLETPANKRSYWSEEITKAKKRFRTFHDAGENVVDQYRLQKADDNELGYKDKYNILYSSTETIRPNLYAQRPSVRVKLRHRDRARQDARDAVMLLEANLGYVIEEGDLDEIMENAVEDLLLPGLSCAWVRYSPTFEDLKDEAGEPMLDPATGEPQQKLLDEEVVLEYVYWKDFLTGVTRGWRQVPWVAKRIWMNKAEATARFGAAKANKLTYGGGSPGDKNVDENADQAEVWEIWCKADKTAYWYSDNYGDDVLDSVKDPLGLKDFFPCPRPMRAISNTRTFVPRALYSQYKAQAEHLNELTMRIRLLTQALRVVGVYDSSQANLANVLSPNGGNRMIAVDAWAQFAQTGGIKGNIEWLPIEQVATVLAQLLQAREVCKNEIYEVTGFSDIVRGVSKASETLGAQNLKANWASARVKKMQKEVQRFARDLIAIAGEVLAEHCSPATLAQFGGVDIPPPEVVQQDPAQKEIFERFKAACALLKLEGRRCALVDIETDSTILADEEAERTDRTAFLGAAGAFLQQAVPAMQTTPELGPLLGAMLMFVVRTFPSSRPIEEEFEKVQKALASKPPAGDEAGKDGAAKAQTAKDVAGIKAQTEGQRIQQEGQLAQAQMQSDAQYKMAELQLQTKQEENRHNEKMMEIAIKQAELLLKEREVAVKEHQAEHGASIAERDAERADDSTIHGQEMAERSQEHTENTTAVQQDQQYEQMANDQASQEADRALTAQTAQEIPAE